MLVSILDLENVIREFNLCIRHIPLVVTSSFNMDNHKEGNKVRKVEITQTKYDYERNWNLKNNSMVNFRLNFCEDGNKYYRLFTLESKTPPDAGKFLVMRCNDTSSSPSWSKAYKGDTLLDAVNAFLVAQIKSNNQ
jgi:hypothetical protein